MTKLYTETAEDYAYRAIRGALLTAANAAHWKPEIYARIMAIENELPRFVLTVDGDGNEIRANG